MPDVATKTTYSESITTDIHSTINSKSTNSGPQVSSNTAPSTTPGTSTYERFLSTTETQASTTNSDMPDTSTLTIPESTSEARTNTPGPKKRTSCCCTCCQGTGHYRQRSCLTCQGDALQDAASCAEQSVKTYDTTDGKNTFFTSHQSNKNTIVKTDPTPSTITPTPRPHRNHRNPTTEEFQRSEEIIHEMAHMTRVQQKDMGFSFKSLVLDCRYSGYSCQENSFSTFVNPVHGNCYSFNSGWPNTTGLKWASRTGRRHGLHLIININQAEYLESGSDTAGIRLVIHSQDRMPFPEDEGITVSPGRSTSVGMRQVRMTHLPHPYGECSDPKKNNSVNNVYEELYPVLYSMRACQKTCYQRYVIKKCGCADVHYPTTGSAFPGETELCETSNEEQEDCKANIELMLRYQELECDCPDTCNSTVYPLEVSVGQWPSRVLKSSILQSLEESIGDSFDIDHPTAYAQNLIKLEVFYEEFNFEMVNEKATYTTGNLLSDVGGVLGLWAGFSIFTVAEILEVFLDLVMLVVFAIFESKGRVGQGEPAKM